MDEHPRVNLNTASREELIAVPGIGPTLAERILAARPFASWDEVLAVPGIGPRALERLKPYITLGAAEPTPPDEAGEADHADDAAFESITPLTADQGPTDAAPAEAEAATGPEPPNEAPAFDDAASEPPTAPAADEGPVDAGPAEAASAAPPWEAPPSPEEVGPAATPATAVTPPPPTASDRGTQVGLAYVVMASALSFVLAVIVTLALLAGINGGLRYGSRAQMRDAYIRFEALDKRLGDLDTQIRRLQDRLSAVETQTRRIEALENEVGALQSNLEATRAEVEDARAQIETLQAQNDRFLQFFKGLRDLMDEAFGPAPDESSPAETTPTPSPTPGTTPAPTPTPMSGGES